MLRDTMAFKSLFKRLFVMENKDVKMSQQASKGKTTVLKPAEDKVEVKKEAAVEIVDSDEPLESEEEKREEVVVNVPAEVDDDSKDDQVIVDV